MADTDRIELSSEAEQRITDVVRSLAQDQVERGIDLNRPMRCDSCDIEKSPLGSSQYGAYSLCNDCLLEFTLLLARGQIDSVIDYMTKPTEGGPPLLSQSTMAREETSPRRLPKRTEKLLPSNEPC